MTINLTAIIFIFFSLTNSIAQDIKYSSLTSEQRGNHNSYLASDGDIYKVGDKIKIGLPSSNCNSTFTFISNGNGHITSDCSGQEVEITKIWVHGTERIGYSVLVHTKGMGFITSYSIEFESALKTKELISKGKTSDEALIELKKEKEKLDLQIITQEEYDKRKLELIKYIK